MKLGKKLGLVLVVVVLLLVVAVGAGVFFIDSLAKSGIEKGATYAMGVEAKLGSASVGLTSGTFSMGHLSIANPPGYKDAQFFGLGHGGVSVSLGSLNQDVVRVPSLELSDITVSLERNASGSNYQTILNNLKRFESGGEASKKESGGKKFVIDEIVIRNVTVKADLVGLPGGVGAVTVPIHEVKLSKVGTAEGGATAGEIAVVVVKAVLASAAAEGKGIIPGDILGDLTGGLGQLTSLGEFDVESIGKVGGAATKVAEQIGGTVQKVGDEVKKGVDDAVKGIGEGLKGLVPGKKK